MTAYNLIRNQTREHDFALSTKRANILNERENYPIMGKKQSHIV